MSCEATIAFDGGKPVELWEITRESEPIEYWSLLAVKPDPSWRFTDAYGHKHRWKQEDDGGWRVTKSITRIEHVPCDGSCGNWDCDGYDTTVYECSKCGERLKPGTSPDNGLKTIPGPVTITAKVRGQARDMPKFQQRSGYVIHVNGSATERGTADVADMRVDSRGYAQVKVHLQPERDHAEV